MVRPLLWTALFLAALIPLLALAGLSAPPGVSPVHGAPALIDSDGDGIPNDIDNCPTVFNPDQADTDQDGRGNACDDDDDNDTVPDVQDNCPLTANANQSDLDGDGIPGTQPALGDLFGGDVCDIDDDGDKFPDLLELFMGTNPRDPCPNTPAMNDEDPDAWPPDFNDDQVVNIIDVGDLSDYFNSQQGDPNYNRRHDLNADGKINIVDVGIVGRLFNKACSP